MQHVTRGSVHVLFLGARVFGAVVAREGGVILRSARSLHALPVVVLSGAGGGVGAHSHKSCPKIQLRAG